MSAFTRRTNHRVSYVLGRAAVMIKPGQLVKIGDYVGLVINLAPPTPGYEDIVWFNLLIGEEIKPCLASHMEVISDAQQH